MASVSQLSLQLLTVHPIDVALLRPCEEMSEVFGERHRRHSAHHLLFAFHVHTLNRQFGNYPRPTSADDISVRQYLKTVDPLLKQLSHWTHSLVNGLLYRYFQNISSLRSEISILIIMIYHNRSEHSLQIPEIHFQRVYLLILFVNSQNQTS